MILFMLHIFFFNIQGQTTGNSTSCLNMLAITNGWNFLVQMKDSNSVIVVFPHKKRGCFDYVFDLFVCLCVLKFKTQFMFKSLFCRNRFFPVSRKSFKCVLLLGFVCGVSNFLVSLSYVSQTKFGYNSNFYNMHAKKKKKKKKKRQA